MDLEAFRWLLTAEGDRLLEAAAASVAASEDPLASQTRLRRTADPA
ncbi:MAG: SAM-dependent methyltransferase, partial [Nocardioides sp.]|nr:SAM-dependent methyltransferase [Nocardioides sp.]